MPLIHTVEEIDGQHTERIFDPNTGLTYFFSPNWPTASGLLAHLHIRHLASSWSTDLTYQGDNAIAVWAVLREQAVTASRQPDSYLSRP